MPIRVLIVDDSPAIRHILQELLAGYADLKVVGTASDPYMAREKIKQLRPDVLTLDIEMPRMNGLEFLERLMRLRPMPVVMVSSLTERYAEITLRALELGAVDYIAKPRAGSKQSLADYGDELVNKIRAAASTDCAVMLHRHMKKKHCVTGGTSISHSHCLLRSSSSCSCNSSA